jgi:chromate transport protein ChrA
MSISTKGLKFRKEYFIFLLPIFFVVHGYLSNFESIPFLHILFLAVKYAAIAFVLCFVLWLLFRNWRKASVYGFFLLCFHFFFGAVHDQLKAWSPESFLVKYTFILPAALVAFTALFIYTRRTKRSFDKLVRYVNVLLLVLIVIDGAQVALKAFQHKEKKAAPFTEKFLACDTCANPDIYFIVADGYPGNRELRELMNFDNTAFEQQLRARGFQVTGETVSNYNSTAYSVSSTLGMNYLQGIGNRKSGLAGINAAYWGLNNNALFEFLRSRGYEIENLSVFRVNDQLPITERGFLVTGTNLITSQTFLSRIDHDIRFNLVSKYKIKSEMKRVTAQILEANNKVTERMMQLAGDHNAQKPRFIYAHLTMPHYPYYFDRNGKPFPVETLTEENKYNKAQFVEYLQWCNGKYLQIVDHILAKSKTPPIILLMGDHGFRHFKEPVDNAYHFMALNSVYFPNKNYSSFYKGMSNVNQFRIVLNTQFGQKLTLLKDSTSFLLE